MILVYRFYFNRDDSRGKHIVWFGLRGVRISFGWRGVVSKLDRLTDRSLIH